MGAYDNRAYDVGKGKPPKERQFKPGQSGNPRGRRRKQLLDTFTMQEVLAEIINETVDAVIGGKDVKLPKRYAILLKLVNDALSGTAPQRLRAIDALHKMGAFDLIPEKRRPDPKQQEAAIMALVEQLAEEARQQGALPGTYENPLR